MKMTGLLTHSCDSNIWETKIWVLLQILGQHEPKSKTLSQNKKQAKKKKLLFEDFFFTYRISDKENKRLLRIMHFFYMSTQENVNGDI